MNIEDMIMNGASDSEIEAMIAAVKAAKVKQEEEKKAKAQAKKETEKKERLKAEARACIINSMIAYAEAFGLMEEGEVWDDEMINKAEETIKQYEAMIPMYIALAKAADMNPQDYKLIIDEDDIEKFFK